MSLVRLPPYQLKFGNTALSSTVDWGLSSYNVPDLWSQTQGAGVTVAVIDSGVAKHSHLECADYRNFTSDSEFYDTLGHGTHVAGIIGSTGGRCKGVAPKARLLSLKVLGHSGFGSNEHVAQAVRHATDVGADIICMSLGGPTPNEGVNDAILEAQREGVIIVCAAGNDSGSVNFPAALPETVAVGAVDSKGRVCEFSCRGRQIVVAAPGEDITSTWLNNSYATISGTSMSAPFVVGVLALYISACNSRGSCRDPIKALQATCKDVGDDGFDEVYGWGLIDPKRMIESAGTFL